MDHMVYADDTQLYNLFRAIPSEVRKSVSNMSDCLDIVRKWMSENKLKLNDEKTEVITFSSKYKPCESVTLEIGDVSVPSAQVVRDLGVLFDQHLTMEKQVNQVCKSAHFHLRSIANIRRYLTSDAAKSLVQSLVTSRLDYCNSLLVGLPAVLLQKLQRVQNTAARVITRTHKYEHITPVLKELHWLPIERRIQYKILLYTYKALHGEAPHYITDMVQVKMPSRTLRSSSATQLCIPHSNTKTYGDRSFRKASAVLWNALPESMRTIATTNSFKRSLKTHLFICEYD